jgi:hypothetical protein
VDGFLKSITDGMKSPQNTINKLAMLANAVTHSIAFLMECCNIIKRVSCVYVPSTSALRNQLVVSHDVTAAGHFGIDMSYGALQQFKYWPSNKESVVEHVRCCPVCQCNKPTAALSVSTHPVPVANRPFECITLDCLTGFPQNRHKHDSVLSIVCRFSKWAGIVPCDLGMTTEALCDILWKRGFA